MSSDAASSPDASTEGYLQRAQLLADLGRYDEAAAELGYAVALEPGNPIVLTVLARVHLAAERPDDALAAADSAVAAAPDFIPAVVARGLALADLRRFREAAAMADRVLVLGPDDAYAQRSGAAILAEARNGQQSLNAAWRGVELAPEEPEAHLVLGLVAARLELFDLAERAYREALRLDPELAEARHDLGVIRLEQRRYAEALEHIAEAAALQPTRMDGGRTIGMALRQLVLIGAGYGMVAAVLVAFVAAGSGTASRIWAGLLAIGGFITVWVLAARLPGSIKTLLPNLVRADRPLALAVYAVAAAPCLILLYTLIGTPWPLALAIAVSALAQFAAWRELLPRA
ncbi:Tetratricopeptide repeat-containing protein [Micromonospora pattaloongensis]|uniref:Tetratricopeptide repeat-containing protein n=1 Tax=Micromonospora pattaloongensis TaxID=405436 RepID=A0A1H3H751_9ACTN|nr:tetratricopeptide repeat protein [Micromonospora pattaloongensis]SDY11055.1 Tetratricopeptide repeat-containing protein [Micromonospora pattaloongensis]